MKGLPVPVIASSTQQAVPQAAGQQVRQLQAGRGGRGVLAVKKKGRGAVTGSSSANVVVAGAASQQQQGARQVFSYWHRLSGAEAGGRGARGGSNAALVKKVAQADNGAGSTECTYSGTGTGAAAEKGMEVVRLDSMILTRSGVDYLYAIMPFWVYSECVFGP